MKKILFIILLISNSDVFALAPLSNNPTQTPTQYDPEFYANKLVEEGHVSLESDDHCVFELIYEHENFFENAYKISVKVEGEEIGFILVAGNLLLPSYHDGYIPGYFLEDKWKRMYQGLWEALISLSLGISKKLGNPSFTSKRFSQQLFESLGFITKKNYSEMEAFFDFNSTAIPLIEITKRRNRMEKTEAQVLKGYSELIFSSKHFNSNHPEGKALSEILFSNLHEEIKIPELKGFLSLMPEDSRDIRRGDHMDILLFELFQNARWYSDIQEENDDVDISETEYSTEQGYRVTKISISQIASGANDWETLMRNLQEYQRLGYDFFLDETGTLRKRGLHFGGIHYVNTLIAENQGRTMRNFAKASDLFPLAIRYRRSNRAPYPMITELFIFQKDNGMVDSTTRFSGLLAA